MSVFARAVCYCLYSLYICQCAEVSKCLQIFLCVFCSVVMLTFIWVIFKSDMTWRGTCFMAENKHFIIYAQKHHPDEYNAQLFLVTASVCQHVRAPTCVSTCPCSYLCVYMSVLLLVCLHAPVPTCVSTCPCSYLCVYMSLFLLVCLHVPAPTCVSTCPCSYLCVNMSLFLLVCECVSGMGRLIAVHSIRGFKAHGSVHRRQFAYRVFFSILINGTSSSANRCFRT